MSRILGMQETSKHYYCIETHVPCAWGRRCSCPRYGSGYFYVSIALAHRELGIRGKQPFCMQKAKTEFPTERDIAFDRVH